MKNIRKKVFETNSSSTHSISISADSDGMLESLFVDSEGVVTITGRDFGWEWKRYNDAKTKASYAAVDRGCDKMLEEVIKEHTGAKRVDFVGINNCYIDHESVGTSHEAFVNKETLKNWLFNPKSWLFTGNDNSSAPPNFYDVNEEDKKYKYELVVEGIEETFKFKESPAKIALTDALYSLFQRAFGRFSASYDDPDPYFSDWPIKLEDGTKRHSYEKFDRNKVTLFFIKYDYDVRVYKIISEKDYPFKLKEL